MLATSRETSPGSTAGLLRDPANLRLFGKLYGDLSAAAVIQATLRITAERLCGSLDPRVARAVAEQRLANDPPGTVIAAFSGDDESDEYLAEILADTRRLVEAKPLGRLA